MSETTKRTLGADMIDLSVPWAKRIDRTHLAARPVDQQALRASTFGAEGGVDGETTNSPAEIGAGRAGREWARIGFVVYAVLFLAVVSLIYDLKWLYGLSARVTSLSGDALRRESWLLPHSTR